MATMHLLTTYTVIDCCNCGALFAVPTQVDEELLRTGKTFYCPNGHGQSYAESTEQKLAKEREARIAAQRTSAARLELLRAEERSHAATKGVVTKQKKKLAKVVAGVCPVDGCHRHFKDLRRHISTKHPDYRATA